MNRLFSSILTVFVALFSFSFVSFAVAPAITSVTVDSYVSAGKYLVVPHVGWGASGTSAVFVMPGQKVGDTTTPAPTFTAPFPSYTSGESPMLGVAGGYGAILAQFDTTSLLTLATGAKATNSNPDIFGGTSGPPIARTALSLTTAGLADGAVVTFIADMKGNVPQLVAIMGNHPNPTVEYDPTAFGGSGKLTVTTATFSNPNNAGESFNSTVGFMVSVDSALAPNPSSPSTPLGIVAQTNHWVGDMFPLLPGFDSSAAVSGNGGAKGTATAKCGTTFYGPAGQTRQITLFFPDSSIPAFFGAGATKADLSVFIDSPGSSEKNPTTAVINTSATNFGGTAATGVAGISVKVPYTFASPKDIGFSITGVVTSDTTTTTNTDSSGGGGGCLTSFLSTQGLLSMMFMLAGILLFRRKARI